MSNLFDILLGIFGLAMLMIVHESGHYLAARAFGMRVITFSIGFGPTFFRVEPEDGYFWFTSFGGKLRLRLGKHDEERHGPTVYQVAMIPFLAYVQIAGMNPFEDIDPEDKGSYSNSSLFGRITTIFGGPLANYLFASVFFFFSFYMGGVIEMPPPGERGTTVQVIPEHPASEAGLIDDDTIVEVGGDKVGDWKSMAEAISSRPGKATAIVVMRDGERLTFTITPKPNKEGKGRIGVSLKGKRKMVSASKAAELAVTRPPVVVKNLVMGLVQFATGQVDGELSGPVRIVKESARMVRRSIADWLYLLGVLSAYLGAFNLFPFPALDGGRLVFLGYELATRKRPNAQLEAQVHIVGLLVLLGLMVYVTIFNDLGLGK